MRWNVDACLQSVTFFHMHMPANAEMHTHMHSSTKHYPLPPTRVLFWIDLTIETLVRTNVWRISIRRLVFGRLSSILPAWTVPLLLSHRSTTSRKGLSLAGVSKHLKCHASYLNSYHCGQTFWARHFCVVHLVYALIDTKGNTEKVKHEKPSKEPHGYKPSDTNHLYYSKG